MALRQLAEKEYKLYLDHVEQAIGHRNVTYGETIEELCRYLFGKKFAGVYARDRIPKNLNGRYAVVNMDKHDMPGSHWVGMAGGLVYDSFGRITLPGRPTERDAEQDVLEVNCGQRCIAWLCVYDVFGAEVASFV